MASLTEKVIRLGFRCLDRASPEAAGRLAFSLFARTPSRKPQSPKEVAALAAAAPGMARAEMVRLAVPDGVVAAHVFAPKTEMVRRTVLMVHGYRSRAEYLLALAETLSTRGSRVVVLDLPGHGASTGRRLHLGMAVEAIDAAWRQFGPFDAMVGHSFGGASVLAAAAGAVITVPARVPARLVTIAAPSALPELFDWFSRRVGLSRQARAAFEAEVLRFSGRPLSWFNAGDMLAGIDAETLVIHAPDDKEVSFRNAEALAGAGRRARLMRADGFGHRRIVFAEPVLEAVGAFLAQDEAGQRPGTMSEPCEEAQPEDAAPQPARRIA
ncbi:alpha-beta hydrolase superfamily lysophospholipase [Hoeflea marina]|uniref:Alpha-beta hydrolase superfamily lysophospholipase n=1 Tax=Hoeflea marina TaxID=274592 RepID=A0A317PSQ1_9HYPH|nr:alpha/beta fold hydrolase [Hoeflea marina]PWW04492.1 alpha-beta hydrolase superfamily lysophospholipase [Hoeflea marina]